MLNEDLRVEKRETAEFSPLPEDVYTVELLDITSEERATYNTRLKPEDEQEKETVLNFQFVLLEGKDGNKDLRGRNVFAGFVPSYLYISNKNGKNTLYQIVEALQGHTVTQEQEAYGITGKDLNSLIGKQCRVTTKNKQNGDKTYTNIDKFLTVKDSYPALSAKERDDARIKPKETEVDKETAEAVFQGNTNIPNTSKDYPEEEINPEDIPFN